jgi:hypothetical protein
MDQGKKKWHEVKAEFFLKKIDNREIYVRSNAQAFS